MATWKWLTGGEDSIRHPVEEVLRLKNEVENLPETAATWQLKTQRRRNHEEILVLLNSWQVPARLAGGSDSNKKTLAVNPNYVHIHKYADVPATCQCGAVLKSANDHYDDEDGKCKLQECNSLWSCEAYATMWRRRKEVLETSSRFLRTPEYAGHRLGVDPQTLGYITKRLHLDRQQIRDDSREELAEVLTELKPNFTAPELGKVVGRNESTIRRLW